MRDLFLNRAKEGCRLSRTIGEERPEIYRIEAGSDLSLYPKDNIKNARNFSCIFLLRYESKISVVFILKVLVGL